jgi:hypothetical protein
MNANSHRARKHPGRQGRAAFDLSPEDKAGTDDGRQV